jgi:hypothetical protein
LSPAVPGTTLLPVDDRAAPGTTEEQLHDRPRPPDGSSDAWWTAREAEARRHRRRILALTVTAVAVVGLATPAFLDAATPDDRPAASGSAGAPDGNLYDGPPRGSLADDGAFVDGVRALPWSVTGDPTGPEVPVADRQVVFAGDVPGGRWALVVAARGSVVDPADLPGDVSTGPDLLDAVWFIGPPDAGADQLSPAAYPGPLKAAWPTALLDQATGVLVVVVSREDGIEVSDRPEVAADGSTSREFREVETTDGVAVVRLGTTGSTAGTSAVYRVVREATATSITPWTTTVLDAPKPAPDIGYPRGEPEEAGRSAAAYAAERVISELGLPPDELEVTAQWVGDVPARGPGQAAVVTVTLPNGAVVVDGQWLLPAQVDGSVQGADCGRAGLPAGAPAARRVYALVCEVVDDTSGAPMQTSLVVVAPPDVVLVRTYDADGSFLSEHPAQDGVVVSRLPIGTATVEAVTRGGISLGRAGLLGGTARFGE